MRPLPLVPLSSKTSIAANDVSRKSPRRFSCLTPKLLLPDCHSTFVALTIPALSFRGAERRGICFNSQRESVHPARRRLRQSLFHALVERPQVLARALREPAIDLHRGK